MMARPGMFRLLFWPTVFALPALAVLILLGNWQMERLAWKEGLIAMAEARAHEAARPLPNPDAWTGLRPEDYEYQRVTLSGRFRHEAEAHVYTVISEPRGGAHQGPGYWIMTPLELADGEGTVIVNRGFVPLDAKEPEAREAGQTQGEAAIVGLMREAEAPTFFTPDNDVEANIWFVRDPAAVAAAHDLGRVAPFFVDAEASGAGGLPQGGETRLVFPNRHLEYAVTWYGLGAALVAVYLAFVWQRVRRRQAA